MKNTDLKKYGLTARFEQEATIYAGMFLARVSSQHRDLYKVICDEGEIPAEVSGKMIYEALGNEDFPAVGDWVMLDRTDNKHGNAIIHNVLTRKNVFERKAAGTHKETQIIAANIDTIFICMSLNEDFNLRRLERYLSIAFDTMAKPVIVLTKADLCKDLESVVNKVLTVNAGADIVTCSSIIQDGYKNILPFIAEGETIVFIGSSGVGKSTLINKLAGSDIFATKEIREYDGKGRHTTTHRQLMVLQNGAIVIDTPGMRELHLDSADLSKSFADVEELVSKCKFSDCSHTAEPGCAVQKALETGELTKGRFDNYKKLQIELGYRGLSSRQIEKKKLDRMFAEVGGMKKAKKYTKAITKK